MRVESAVRLGRKMVCGAAIGALAGSAYAQTDFFWRDPVDDVWSNSGAWSPAGGPGQLDNVFIDVSGTTGGYTCTLDIVTPGVANFTLSALAATFNVNDFAFGTNADLSLSNGTIRGNSSAAGAFLVGGDAAMTDATLRDMNQFAVVGDATASGMSFSNIAAFDIGANGSMTVSDSSFVGVTMVNNNGSMELDTTGGGLLSIDDTCVGNGKNMSWSGAGDIAMTNNGEIMNDGAFVIQDGGGTMSGNGKEPAAFMNNGTVSQELTGRFGEPGTRGSLTTTFNSLDFVNNGTVSVGFGEMLFTGSTGVTNDGLLERGVWNVFGGSTLTFDNQTVTDIINGAEVNVAGEFTTFQAVEILRTIGQGSAFRISDGYDFLVTDEFTNNGLLRVGFDSVFDAQDLGLTNLSNSVLTDGIYEIVGTLAMQNGQQVQFLEADVTLIGADSVLTGIDALEIVGSQGAFALEQGRAFETADDFLVFQGGRVRVGVGSFLNVNGQLVNFNNGIFEDGFFEIQGTLQAPDLVISEISNELILDGVGSQFINQFGDSALDALTRIQSDGILRLRGGRTLENLDHLIVDGILEIDPTAGRVRERGLDRAQLSTAGDMVVNPGSELIMVIGGTEPGNFASILVGGDARLGGDSGEGGVLSVVLSSAYEPKIGDEFVLIEALGAVTGTFEDIQIVGLRNGLAVEVDILPQFVIARVTPTPATAAVLGFGGLAAARRRRR